MDVGNDIFRVYRLGIRKKEFKVRARKNECEKRRYREVNCSELISNNYFTIEIILP
jgi:hypothetical protein